MSSRVLANGMVRSDPVQDAFNEATKYFKESLTQDECKKIWLDGMSSLEDVENVLLEAKIRRFEEETGSSLAFEAFCKGSPQ
jgi:hypothetical protein